MALYLSQIRKVSNSANTH